MARHMESAVTSEKHREYREMYDDMFKYHDVTMCFTGLHGMKYG